MKRWYVIRSKPRKEELLWEQLLLRGIDAYYPRIKALRVNPRARQYKPYFPGYMFINIDLMQLGFSALQWMPGAVGLVNFGHDVVPVPENLICTIQERIKLVDRDASGMAAQLKPGDVVVLRSGSFSGYEAIFDCALSGNDRVRILLKLLHDQHVRMVVPVDHISLVKQP